MKCSSQWLLTISLILILWGMGCTTTPDPVSKLQPFFLSRSFENYQSSGRILLVVPEQKYAGELEFSLSKDLELRLQILTPIIGSLLYEVRVNQDHFMILDFQEQKYFLDQNVAQVRQQWLGVDISLLELGWVIWGRIPQSNFNQHQGQILSSDTLRMESDNTVFFITLGTNGMMEHMTKTIDDTRVYEVKIQEYQNVAGKFFPRKIQILHSESHSRLLLVMNDIIPDVVRLPNLSFFPTEGMTPYRYE